MTLRWHYKRLFSGHTFILKLNFKYQLTFETNIAPYPVKQSVIYQKVAIDY